MTRTATALLVALVSFACGLAGAGAATQSSPSPATGASPSTTATTDQAPPSGLPAFSCIESTGDGTGRAMVTKARAATASGYDRFVLEFDGAVPSYRVKQNASATFVEDASGKAVHLVGSSGVLITLRNSGSAASFNGPADVLYGWPELKESRQLGDFEGTVSWGLGLAQPRCFRAFTLTSPDRLVIDVQEPGF